MRRHLFTAPFVVTSACGGPRAEPRPVPPPVGVTSTADARPAIDAAPPDATAITFDDPICVRGTEPVDCPLELLPVADPDRLVVAGAPGVCWVVIEPDLDVDRDAGRVRCPDGGPTVELPAERSLLLGDRSYVIDERTLTCSREQPGNPPGYAPIDRCPRALLPTLINGAAPLATDDRGCWWHAIGVTCDAPADDDLFAELTGEIVDVAVDGAGVRIIINRGTSDGVAVGWRGRITGLRHSLFTITSCNTYSCKATIGRSVDEVQHAAHDVELGP